MENTINRKDYRRQNVKNDNYYSEKIGLKTTPNVHSVQSKIGNQIINSMLLLLVLLLLKFFGYQQVFDNIKEEFRNGITFNQIEAYAKNLYEKFLVKETNNEIMIPVNEEETNVDNEKNEHDKMISADEISNNTSDIDLIKNDFKLIVPLKREYYFTIWNEKK